MGTAEVVQNQASNGENVSPNNDTDQPKPTKPQRKKRNKKKKRQEAREDTGLSNASSYTTATEDDGLEINPMDSMSTNADEPNGENKGGDKVSQTKKRKLRRKRHKHRGGQCEAVNNEERVEPTADVDTVPEEAKSSAANPIIVQGALSDEEGEQIDESDPIEKAMSGNVARKIDALESVINECTASSLTLGPDLVPPSNERNIGLPEVQEIETLGPKTRSPSCTKQDSPVAATNRAEEEENPIPPLVLSQPQEAKSTRIAPQMSKNGQSDPQKAPVEISALDSSSVMTMEGKIVEPSLDMETFDNQAEDKKRERKAEPEFHGSTVLLKSAEPQIAIRGENAYATDEKISGKEDCACDTCSVM